VTPHVLQNVQGQRVKGQRHNMTTYRHQKVLHATNGKVNWA